jgi:hypothetical protein
MLLKTDADAVVVGIRHINIALPIYSHAVGSKEFSGCSFTILKTIDATGWWIQFLAETLFFEIIFETNVNVCICLKATK